MRPRTPAILWIPFVFSIGTVSWALLLGGLVLLAAVIVTPAIRDAKAAESERNNYQATLDLLDQRIALQKEFITAATQSTSLQQRLAARQLNINPKDQDILYVDPAAQNKDRSVEGLIRESLIEVTPKPVEPLPAVVEATVGNAGARPLFIIIAGAAIAVSFFIGVKYERA